MRGAKPELRAIEGGLAAVPPAPEWMPKEAADEWRRIMPGLVHRRTLSPEDMGQVENYCLAIAQVRQCQKVLAVEPMFVQSETSAPRPHPAYRTMHSAMTIARQLAAELGLTPVSRQRTAVDAKPAGKKTWEGLIDG
ncbi:MAG: phage terminase small subunit P27 family [Caenispirillum sp.]|nr:phage terminase small subunit P27 family [Caenispirillum sp.]